MVNWLKVFLRILVTVKCHQFNLKLWPLVNYRLISYLSPRLSSDQWYFSYHIGMSLYLQRTLCIIYVIDDPVIKNFLHIESPQKVDVVPLFLRQAVCTSQRTRVHDVP